MIVYSSHTNILSNLKTTICSGVFAKTNPQLDFNPKPIPKLESNAKKPSEITAQPLVTKQKKTEAIFTNIAPVNRLSRLRCWKSSGRLKCKSSGTSLF